MNADRKYVLRLTGRQHDRLKKHLFPSDGLEAVALMLCGLRKGRDRTVLMVHEVFEVPHADCERASNKVCWPMAAAVPMLSKAMKRGMAFVKIHSHPGGYPLFSAVDDLSDGELFDSLESWTGSSTPNGSVVMLPDGSMFGRVADGASSKALSRISVAGDQIRYFGLNQTDIREQEIRNAQAFGEGTVSTLRQLKVGVVGCSGTGSWVCELLGRNSVGEFVLVDPETVEFKNLNRIINASIEDANAGALKVDVQKRAIEGMGFGARVSVHSSDLTNLDVIHDLADCDVLFGCMDSHDGRDLLNRIAVYYNIPYFDVGVALAADGKGGVSHVSGRTNYLQPDGSSLLSRGHINPEMVDAQSCQRHDPALYRERLSEGYIANANVESPAVASVNSLYAALAVNDFIARVHGYRYSDEHGEIRVCLVNTYMQMETHEEPCSRLANSAGRGDCVPLLGLPKLSVPCPESIA